MKEVIGQNQETRDSQISHDFRRASARKLDKHLLPIIISSIRESDRLKDDQQSQLKAPQFAIQNYDIKVDLTFLNDENSLTLMGIEASSLQR